MIHNNSKDPVFVKKINLNLWRLKDEITSVISQQIQVIKDPVKLNIGKLEKEYHSNSPLIEEGELVESGDLDTGEDEMAKAIAEAEANESSDAKETDNLDISDNAKELNLNTKNLDTAIVIQRSPQLPAGKVFKGRAILSEINMGHMYLFCSEEFLQGESIVIDFLIPKRFVTNVQVEFCRTYNMRSRIIGVNRLPFRVGVSFTFLKEGERTLLRQFITSIEPDLTLPEKKAPAAAAAEEEDDDEFGELDDLDL